MVEEVIPAGQCALLVVDVQNDYCHQDGVFGRAGLELGMIQAAVERIEGLVAAARRAAESTVRDAFMRDWPVVLVEDCSAAPTKSEHDGAVYNARTYFGRVLDAATLEGYWTAPAAR